MKDWKEKDVIYGLIQPSKMNAAIALLLCRQSKNPKGPNKAVSVEI